MGRYLLQGLVSKGIKIKALTRNATRAQGIFSSPNLFWFQGDIQKVKDLENALEGVDSLIINLNALEQVGDKQWQPLHQGLATLLVFARMHQVRHIIFHSMMASHEIPGERIKLKLPVLQQMAERFIANSGISFTNFRTSLFLENFYHRFSSGNQIRIHKVDFKPFQWISAWEFGQMLALAICNPKVLNQTLYLQGEKSCTIPEVARIIARSKPGNPFQVEILDSGFQKFLSLIRPKKAEEMEWLKWVNRVAEFQQAENTWEILGKPKVVPEHFGTMVHPMYEVDGTLSPDYASKQKMALVGL